MLLYIRHRGAFLSIYNGFYAICVNLLQSKEHCFIPIQRLDELIDSISNVNAILSVTRRSGGLPFLVQALTISQHDTLRNRAVFSVLISRLSSLLSQPESSTETKVHCLNVLRALFKVSKIGTEIVQFADEILSICICGFTSRDWAVRNGCLMLFSVLITRIFGCKGANETGLTLSQITFAEFYSRFNVKIVPLMLEQLALSTKNIKSATCLHPSLFPILSLLNRLAPGNPRPLARCREFAQLVISCFDSFA
jgi:thyroid adenoma-associated protein